MDHANPDPLFIAENATRQDQIRLLVHTASGMIIDGFISMFQLSGKLNDIRAFDFKDMCEDSVKCLLNYGKKFLDSDAYVNVPQSVKEELSINFQVFNPRSWDSSIINEAFAALKHLLEKASKSISVGRDHSLVQSIELYKPEEFSAIEEIANTETVQELSKAIQNQNWKKAMEMCNCEKGHQLLLATFLRDEISQKDAILGLIYFDYMASYKKEHPDLSDFSSIFTDQDKYPLPSNEQIEAIRRGKFGSFKLQFRFGRSEQREMIELLEKSTSVISLTFPGERTFIHGRESRKIDCFFHTQARLNDLEFYGEDQYKLLLQHARIFEAALETWPPISVDHVNPDPLFMAGSATRQDQIRLLVHTASGNIINGFISHLQLNSKLEGTKAFDFKEGGYDSLKCLLDYSRELLNSTLYAPQSIEEPRITFEVFDPSRLDSTIVDEALKAVMQHMFKEICNPNKRSLEEASDLSDKKQRVNP